MLSLTMLVGPSTWGRTAKTYSWHNYDWPEWEGLKRAWLPFGLSTISVDVGHWRVPFVGWRLPYVVQLLFS